ncbi:MAG: S8 family serine peptidase [Micropepsaceae bacterium]
MSKATRTFAKILAILLACGGLCVAVPLAFASDGSSSSGDGESNADSPDSAEPDPSDLSSHGDDGEEETDDHSGSGDSGSDGGDDSNSGDSDDHSGSNESGDSGSDQISDSHSGDSDSTDSSNSGSGGSSRSGSDDSGDDSHGSGSSSSSSSSSESGHGSSDQSGGSQQSSSDHNNGTSNRGSDSSRKSSVAAQIVESHLEVTENGKGEQVRKGEVVLVSTHADLTATLAKQGLQVIEVFRLPSMGLSGFRVAVPEKQSDESVLKRLRKADPSGIATFNHVYVPARGGAIAPVESLASAPMVGKRTNARIGLVDARVDTHHPMLREVNVTFKEFGIANSSDEDHGTAVASRIASVAPGSKILVASVFSQMNNGDEMASVDAIARGLDWLARNNVPVINLSLAGPANPILQAVTARLVAKGHVLVAAVGNEGPHAAPQYPAAYDDVVGVTAVDAQNHVYLYANQGAYVDFAAPGVNTKVAKAEGTTETVSGTSYAAPVVAVALAKLINQPDRQRAQHAEEELAKSAKDMGEPGRDPVFGFGVIDLLDE